MIGVQGLIQFLFFCDSNKTILEIKRLFVWKILKAIRVNNLNYEKENFVGLNVCILFLIILKHTLLLVSLILFCS